MRSPKHCLACGGVGTKSDDRLTRTLKPVGFALALGKVGCLVSGQSPLTRALDAVVPPRGLGCPKTGAISVIHGISTE
jgi:hypothetical protein